MDFRNHRMIAAALLLSAPMASAWLVGCGDDEVFILHGSGDGIG